MPVSPIPVSDAPKAEPQSSSGAARRAVRVARSTPTVTQEAVFP